MSSIKVLLSNLGFRHFYIIAKAMPKCNHFLSIFARRHKPTVKEGFAENGEFLRFWN